jgi:hypothetical protein
MCYECVGLPPATRLRGIRVVTAMANVSRHLFVCTLHDSSASRITVLINITAIFYFLIEGNIFVLTTI